MVLPSMPRSLNIWRAFPTPISEVSNNKYITFSDKFLWQYIDDSVFLRHSCLSDHFTLFLVLSWESRHLRCLKPGFIQFCCFSDSLRGKLYIDNTRETTLGLWEWKLLIRITDSRYYARNTCLFFACIDRKLRCDHRYAFSFPLLNYSLAWYHLHIRFNR